MARHVVCSGTPSVLCTQSRQRQVVAGEPVAYAEKQSTQELQESMTSAPRASVKEACGGPKAVGGRRVTVG